MPCSFGEKTVGCFGQIRELLPKTRQVNLQFSEPLLKAVRQRAAQEGILYQKFIRLAVEGSLKE